MLDTLREAEALAEALDDQRRLVRVSAFLTYHFWQMGDHDRALETSQRALLLATTLGDVGLQARANLHLGEVFHSLGDYHRAIDTQRRNIEILAGEFIHERSGGPGIVSVTSRTRLVQSLTEVGAFAEGIARGEEAIQIAEAADNPFSLIQAYTGVGSLYLCKGDFLKAIASFDRGLGLCQLWSFSS